MRNRAQGTVSMEDAVSQLVLLLPLLLGRLQKRQMVHQIVPIQVLVEEGTDRALLHELPRVVGVLSALEHPKHLSRDEVLQQCHCRPLVQAAAVTRRVEVPEERHDSERGVPRELS